MTRLIKFHEETFNCEDDCSEQVLKMQSIFNHVPTTIELSTRTITVDSLPSSSTTTNSTNPAAGSSAESLRLQVARERLSGTTQRDG